MSINITKKPLLPVITITKDDASTYTFNPHNSVFDFRVASLAFTPSFDNVGGTFSLVMMSTDATNSAMNTFLTNVNEGNEIGISLGKTDATSTLVFTGIIERKEIDEGQKDFMRVTLSGPDWGSYILKSKLSNAQWIQKKSGNDLDATDNDTLISAIVSDLLTTAQTTPAAEYSATDLGVVYSASNVVVPEIRMPQFEANFEYLDDKLTELDGIAGTTHYIDPSKNFIMKDPTALASYSGILLTDDVTSALALSHDQTKLGLIAPGSKYVRTLENHKRRIYGLGGDLLTKDQSSATDTTSTTLYDKSIALMFTPRYRYCHSIGVKVSKTGSPSGSLIMELIEDNGGEPSGSILRDSIRRDSSYISSSAGWHYFDIGEDLTIGNNYWIVLIQTGDVSNTYNWHRDALDTGTHSTSTDLITWTPATTANRWNFAFEEWTSSPVLGVYSDFAAANSKHFVEHVVRKTDITDLRTMNNYLTTESARLFKRKEIFKGPIYAPDTLIQTGQNVYISKTASGYQVADNYIISSVEYVFEADDIGSTGQMYYNIEAFKYTTY